MTADYPADDFAATARPAGIYGSGRTRIF